MASELTGSPGERLARDLRRIRSDREVSIDDIHRETMLATELIERFESDALFDHPSYNEVYLRSFVRTYAGCIDIEPEEAVEALDAALNETYTNQLAATYLDEDPIAPPSTSIEGDKQESGQPDESEVVSASSEDIPADAEPSDASVRASPPEGDREANPSPMKPSGDTSTESSSNAQPDEDKSTSPWADQSAVLIGIAVVVVFVAGMLVLTGIDQNGEEASNAPDNSEELAVNSHEPDSEEADPENTADPADDADQPTPASIELGDTLKITVVAEEGAISPIRVQRDDDLRRPYYIEEGEGAVFPTETVVILEDQLDDIQLLLEGYEFPTDMRDDQGRIVIDRETAEAFADTLHAEPVSLPAERDTFNVGG